MLYRPPDFHRIFRTSPLHTYSIHPFGCIRMAPYVSSSFFPKSKPIQLKLNGLPVGPHLQVFCQSKGKDFVSPYWVRSSYLWWIYIYGIHIYFTGSLSHHKLSPRVPGLSLFPLSPLPFSPVRTTVCVSRLLLSKYCIVFPVHSTPHCV